MSLIYLGLGTNLGDKVQNLNDAVMNLSLEVGDVLSLSSFHTSLSWGYDSENEFLDKTQQIERNMGRTSKLTMDYEDRLIDIDILLYDNLIINQPTLKIPHYLMVKRNFVLIPLIEIAPELVDPVSNKKFKDFIIQ